MRTLIVTEFVTLDGVVEASAETSADASDRDAG